MAKGGHRPGAGRKPGAKNKRTVEREKAVEAVAEVIAQAIPAAFDGDAHALLMALYKDPEQPTDLRLDAAKAAIGYEKPKLASIDSKVSGGLDIRTKEERDAAVAAALRADG